jgi:penicillin-binding protein 1A
MEVNQKMTAAQATKLKALPIVLNYKKLDENTGYAPYFREVLKDEVRESLKGITKSDGEPYDIYDDGLRIFTTINPKMQTYAEEAVAQQMPLLQKALNAQRNVKTGSVWKGHQNVLDAAMKAKRPLAQPESGRLSDADAKKTFPKKQHEGICLECQA